MTQEQLSEVADVTVQYLQRVEAGRENLTVRSLLRLAALLEVTIVDLFATPTSRESRPGRPVGRRKQQTATPPKPLGQDIHAANPTRPAHTPRSDPKKS